MCVTCDINHHLQKYRLQFCWHNYNIYSNYFVIRVNNSTKMGFTERQKSDLKKVINEHFSDKNFLETFAVKIADIVSQKMMAHIDKLDTKITALEKQMSNIQDENEDLKIKIDNLEQQSKCNQLRVFGVPEGNNEKLDVTIKEIFENKMDTSGCQLDHCFRLGPFRKDAKHPRPILVTFSDVQQRNMVFRNKSKLKGSKVAITEELTRARYELLISCKEKFGKEKVWTSGGNIYTNINGKKYRMRNSEDMNQV